MQGTVRPDRLSKDSNNLLVFTHSRVLSVHHHPLSGLLKMEHLASLLRPGLGSGERSSSLPRAAVEPSPSEIKRTRAELLSAMNMLLINGSSHIMPGNLLHQLDISGMVPTSYMMQKNNRSTQLPAQGKATRR